MEPDDLKKKFFQLVQAFEKLDNGPKKLMISVFPPGFSFPPVEAMSEEELGEKLNDIEAILGEHNIIIELSPELPDTILYEYLVKEVIPHEEIFEDPLGFRLHINGCDGNCPECFQLDYCQTAKEI